MTGRPHSPQHNRRPARPWETAIGILGFIILAALVVWLLHLVGTFS